MNETSQERLINALGQQAPAPNIAFTFNPYPKHNSDEWKATHAKYVPCRGPTGTEVQDIKAFAGHLRDFPAPGFGSYELLGIDANICYERETRFGQYSESAIEWDTIDWGELQQECLYANRQRFDLQGSPNEFLSQYDPDSSTGHKDRIRERRQRRNDHERPQLKVEPRTALLLRSYTGKEYSDNDRQVIRAFVAELSLRTGGEYQVILFVQVRESSYNITDETTYRAILEEQIPREFHNMTVLWNDAAVHSLYPRLDPGSSATVHTAQWLSVQKFIQDSRHFSFVWNWEMDSRLIGHNYDTLAKLAAFAKAQPRKGLWERNERFYIPAVHGDFSTTFRNSVETQTAGSSIWGPPSLPFIRPVGPAPPTFQFNDDYEWGVGEEADLIALSPMFDPVGSGWIMSNQVWGFSDAEHPPESLPRRVTIITQSRVSRRLLDAMHIENLRGNHVASEMTPQTVALLHGFKAVYAPVPVFFDRAWSGAQLQRLFNSGPLGQSGGPDCAMGWGREGRFAGSTWYYRATPPQRLYSNWMGYEDAGVGGAEWEEQHGRPCLPAMFLHPVKDDRPTRKGFVSTWGLPPY